MGNTSNKISTIFHRRKLKPTTKIGQSTPCPICGQIMPASTTYQMFNNHIDSCVPTNNQNPNNNHNNLLQNNSSASNRVEAPSSSSSNSSHREEQFPQLLPHRVRKDDPNLEYFWSKVPIVDLNPSSPLSTHQKSKAISSVSSSSPSISSLSSSSPASQQKYKWERRAYNKNDVNSASLRKLSPSEVAKLSFEKKQIWLRDKCEMRRIPWTQGADWIKINPDNILLNSLNEIQRVDLHKEVKIQIIGDKVNDAGGLLREWIHLCMKEIFLPDTGMFLTADTQDVTYKINKDADQDDHILSCFRLLGKIIGKAIFERITMNACFDRSILNYILGRPTTLQDLFYYDTQLYNSMISLSENVLGEDDFIDVFAVYKKLVGGAVEVIELVPNGEEEIVSESNKMLYIQKKIQYLCVDSVKEFLDAMCTEIYRVVPKAELSVFEPHELEMILIGVPFIDLEEWKANTEYNGYSNTHLTVKRFWQIMEEFNQHELSKFLQYCTGSARTPVEGFKKLESNRGNYAKFNVKQVQYQKVNPYPKAHTCFNRLELPDYPNLETMRLYMKAVVNNELDGVYGLD